MHRSTTKPLIVAALLAILILAAIAASCHGPTPPLATPNPFGTSTASASPRPTTPVATSAIITPTAITFPTSTFIATAQTMSPTPRATATSSPTAIPSANAPTPPATLPETPTIVPLAPHTGAPQATDSAPFAALAVIAGLLLILYGVILGWRWLR